MIKIRGLIEQRKSSLELLDIEMKAVRHAKKPLYA
jgi:hypothetical protein